MSRIWCAGVVVMACAVVAPAQTPPKKPAPVRPAARQAATRSASARRPATAGTAHKPTARTSLAHKAGTKAGAGVAHRSHTGTAASKSALARRGRRVRATPRRPKQMVPTPERYKEIQQALASKGYLKPEDASGVWDQNSSDALRRFQSDQKLQGTGKIDSLSLIALGLGPKHDSAEAKPSPLAPPTVSDQSPLQSR